MSTPTQVPGFTVTGVAGIGADGTVLRAHTDDGRDVVLRTVAQAPEGLVRRARVAHRVHHPGVAAVLEPVTLPDGGLAVASAFVPGPALATLRAARSGLSTPECVQVAVELLTALEALHAAGIVHGDVSPANVIVAPAGEDSGRLVLVDVVGGSGAHRGTRGFRAPELDQGAPASAGADVYSAAQVAVWVADPASRPEVAELLAPMLLGESASRPSAYQGMALLDGVARVQVRLAPAEALASATLREHAARDLTTRARLRRPRGRRRHRARRRRWVLRGVATVLAVLVGVGGLRLLGVGPPGQDGGGSVGADGGTESTGSTVGTFSTDSTGSAAGARAGAVLASVRELLAARDEALVGGDREALAALTVPGSALADADSALLGELAGAGIVLGGYRTEVLDLELVDLQLPNSTPGHPERVVAIVRTSLRQSEHERTDPDGEVHVVPAQPEECVQLRLVRADSGAWRAATAAPC